MRKRIDSNATTTVRVRRNMQEIAKLLQFAILKAGTATLVAGTVTVAEPSVKATSRIVVVGQPGGSTRLGSPHVTTLTAGTSFVITSVGGVADDYPVLWAILEP